MILMPLKLYLALILCFGVTVATLGRDCTFACITMSDACCECIGCRHGFRFGKRSMIPATDFERLYYLTTSFRPRDPYDARDPRDPYDPYDARDTRGPRSRSLHGWRSPYSRGRPVYAKRASIRYYPANFWSPLIR